MESAAKQGSAVRGNSTSIELQGASLDIWDKKYRLKDAQGNPVDKDIDGTYARVARALAEVEDESVRQEWEQRFVWALKRGAIPQQPVPHRPGQRAGQDRAPERPREKRIERQQRMIFGPGMPGRIGFPHRMGQAVFPVRWRGLRWV